MAELLLNGVVTINNVNIAYVPNTVVFTEGLGEQDVRTQTAGGGAVEQVYVDNVETRLSMFKFSLIPTKDSVELARSWKTNRNENVITYTEGTFSRSFAQAALTSDYEVNASADGNIDLEFKTRSAI